MGTTYSIVAGWGFQLEEADFPKLATLLKPETWEDYDSAQEWAEENGEYEVLEYAIGYGSEFKLFKGGASFFYDYGDDDPYYVYLKRATETLYDSGFNKLKNDRIILTGAEVIEFNKLGKTLGRELHLVPFAAMSVG